MKDLRFDWLYTNENGEVVPRDVPDRNGVGWVRHPPHFLVANGIVKCNSS